ncbi:MAG: hypothetical protein WCG29_03725 [Desulfomonile sp.]
MFTVHYLLAAYRLSLRNILPIQNWETCRILEAIILRPRRSLVFCSALLFLLSVGVPSSSAWEFKLEGSFNYIFEQYSQMGSSGFFGKYNVDNSTGSSFFPGGSYTNKNGWFGFQVNDLVSGSNAGRHYQYLELWPEFKLNNAIRFRGKYRLGNYGDPIASDYITNTRPGVDVATSDGQWTMWWVDAQTPLGIIVVGKRPEAFGLGLQYNGEYNNTTEGVALVAPHGPFRISFAVRPFWPEPPNSQISARKVGDNPNLVLTPNFPYYNLYDRSGIMSLALRYFMTYQSGPIDAGFFFAWQGWHAGTEARAATNTQASLTLTTPPAWSFLDGPEGKNRFNPYDLDQYHGTIYLKYFDGRFFFNTEWAFWYETDEVVKSLSEPLLGPTSINRKGLRFMIESWRRMFEFGALVGPTKVSFLYAYLPGPDRRGGYLYDNQPYFQAPGQACYGVFRPYSYLLGYIYGSGVNAYDTARNGYINAAEVLATRLDYAVAANLNLFGTFLWAQRSSNGYSWGYLRPALNPTVTSVVNAAADGIANFIRSTPYVSYQNNDGAPNTPDRGLGWEVTAGLEWMILERYKLRGLLAYWHPGKWFNYACVDRGVQAWNRETRTNINTTPYYPFGTNPDRVIDPIVGGEVALQVEF